MAKKRTRKRPPVVEIARDQVRIDAVLGAQKTHETQTAKKRLLERARQWESGERGNASPEFNRAHADKLRAQAATL